MARPDFKFVHRARVRWAEVDRQDVVFHAHYFAFFDTAQTEYLRNLDYPYPQGLEEKGHDLFIVEAKAEFSGSATFDDEIDICVRVSRLGKSSLTFSFEIYRADGDNVLVTGRDVYVNVDSKTEKSVALPSELLERIREFEGDALES